MNVYAKSKNKKIRNLFVGLVLLILYLFIYISNKLYYSVNYNGDIIEYIYNFMKSNTKELYPYLIPLIILIYINIVNIIRYFESPKKYRAKLIKKDLLNEAGNVETEMEFEIEKSTILDEKYKVKCYSLGNNNTNIDKDYIVLLKRHSKEVIRVEEYDESIECKYYVENDWIHLMLLFNIILLLPLIIGYLENDTQVIEKNNPLLFIIIMDFFYIFVSKINKSDQKRKLEQEKIDNEDITDCLEDEKEFSDIGTKLDRSYEQQELMIITVESIGIPIIVIFTIVGISIKNFLFLTPALIVGLITIICHVARNKNDKKELVEEVPNNEEYEKINLENLQCLKKLNINRFSIKNGISKYRIEDQNKNVIFFLENNSKNYDDYYLYDKRDIVIGKIVKSVKTGYSIYTIKALNNKLFKVIYDNENRNYGVINRDYDIKFDSEVNIYEVSKEKTKIVDIYPRIKGETMYFGNMTCMIENVSIDLDLLLLLACLTIHNAEELNRRVISRRIM